ncbi:phospholipid-translocating P-type ATPase [Tilletiaria anomala UBC 951]|uniref:Phospholipid-transporting ATPase n=1 Tax=Tilletiaria anomala (strain ATCC 24038 / CBS 436.72 / UBC 951) TaxID=1037660 RepID=A0A066W870_TILAU|nr:phospholipid-translocating P-type ATPase [Tilletiaria anomala UBC 951]KDN46965.1 phospholipid-translocating P-type ATPase [Tilletiaria anomala UBC 951]
MDPFADILSRPTAGTAQSSRAAVALQDPFASFNGPQDYSYPATADQSGGTGPPQSHVLLDADDIDLIGGGDDMSFGGVPDGGAVSSSSRGKSSTLHAATPPYQSGGAGMLGSIDSGLPFSGGGMSSSNYADAPYDDRGPFGDAYEASTTGNFKAIEADDELTPSEEYNHKSLPYGRNSSGGARGSGAAPGLGRDSGTGVERRSKKEQEGIAALRARKTKASSRFDGVSRSLRAIQEDFNRAMGRQSNLKVKEGERVIQVNDQTANDLLKFSDNYVSTSKYNIITFLPKFLIEQFSKYANVFFLFTACIQQIPGVSPTNRYTTIIPLALVLLATAFKEMKEDMKRHNSDAELNSRLAQVLEPGTGGFDLRKWQHIQVGDIVRVESNEFFPADMVLLSSSEPEGLCYVETANLDGETNLKIKQASPDTSRLTTPSSAAALRGNLTSEQPNNSLYTFDATLNIQLSSTPGFSGTPMRKVPLSPEQLLLRGAQLRNTPWVYGLVVFTGHETKLMRNATATPVKRTAVEKDVNTLILLLFCLLLALSLASAIGAIVRNTAFANEMQYLLLQNDSKSKGRVFIEDTLTFVIAYNNLIPISLIVMMEIIKYQQAMLINSDLDMYYAPTDTPALCRTSSLVEELGQIDYIFSDKTGTLTRNEMEFKQASIGGVSYTDVIDESKQGTGEVGPDGREIGGQRTWHELKAIMDGTLPDDGSSGIIDEFLTLLAVCHTVIPERKGNKVVFQASSPDEAALVAGAECMGYQFVTRKPRSVFVNVRGRELEYEVLNVCEFNSTRKRMSTVVRGPDGKIKLYCKGADTVIISRLSEKQSFTDSTVVHLEDYATEGLRTLCVAMREISEQEYRQWSRMYDQAAAQIQGRGEALDQVAEVIEQNLYLLGATAIEDKLQEGVPETIHTLQNAGIKIWVLTGDRQETAINIGLSCKLISESMTLVIVNEDNAHDTADFLSKRLHAVKSQRSAGEFEELALIIDGKSLEFALEKDLSKMFLELAIMCKAVVCCRVSPLQKALVVKLVKKHQRSILLAIGDGANDVSMIQAAHVGVGISGVEGLQAARSADVAISQFRYLRKLLLVHGTWSYTRLSKMILYSFYKNIVLYMTQFWFSFQSSFSGQVPFEGWTLSFYNVIFTVLPPLVIGIFDQYLSARMLDRYPQLYRQTFFSKRRFAGWTLNAFYHSLLCYIFVTTAFWGSPQLAGGYNSYQWIWGTTLFCSVLVTVLGKAALVSDLWTKYTVAAIPGSFVFTLVFLILYAIIAPLIPRIHLSLEYQGIVPRLYGFSLFWFCLILVPVVCLLRDFCWKYWQRTYQPKSYHIIQEVQKHNLQDYRPRMDQFQKAIRKVRAVQRMRRTRGFAFSQTEGEGEQAKLIRRYDTTVQRPSGL